MRFVALARTHSLISLRHKALWLTAIPLTAFATLLAVISPARPGTGGVEDLAFTGQIIAIFTGIAYAAAFTDFFTASARRGMGELEAAMPVSPLSLRGARILGVFSVVIAPSLLVLTLMGVVQTISGNLWALPAGLAVVVTIIGPAALIAISLSALAGALLPRATARIAGVLVWFLLVFSSPLVPLPTPNGTMLTVIGDAIAVGYFGGSPIYPLAFNGTAWAATISLVAQFIIIALLLTAGSTVASRAGKR